MARRGPLAALLATALSAAAVLLASCGVPGTGGPGLTAAQEKAREVLGRAPTGLAKTVVDRGYVVVAVEPDYPPQSYVDRKTGEPAGFDVDVARRVGELLGLEVRFEQAPWPTVPTGLQRGRFDVSIGSLAPTPERERLLDFTRPYYYAIAQTFVRTGGPQVTGPHDLDGQTVGVVAGTTCYDYLRQHTSARVTLYTSDAELFRALRKGEVAFAVTSGASGQEAILGGAPIEFSGRPLYYEGLAAAVKKGESDWLALLDWAVKTMHEDGSLSALSKKWFFGLDVTVKQT